VLCARQSFARLLDEYCSRIVRFVADVPEDLSPPPFVYEGIQCASQILQVYEASLGQDSRRVATGDSSATDDSNVDGDKGNDAAEDDEDLDAADAAAATALPVDANGDRMCVEFFFFFFLDFIFLTFFLTFFFFFLSALRPRPRPCASSSGRCGGRCTSHRRRCRPPTPRCS
jgi:hypothetical protein